MLKITDRAVRQLTLPPDKNEEIHMDNVLPGFCIRLRPGSKSFYFRYDRAGHSHKMPLGSFPGIDSARARRAAAELHHRVSLGDDPAVEKARAKFEDRTTLTFGRAVDMYLQWRQSPKNKRPLRSKSLADVTRHLEKNMAGLHGRNLREVSQGMVAAELTKLATTAPVQANRTRASLHKFFRWARGEGLIEVNPVEATNKQPEGDARDRHLSDVEIKQLWAALPDNDYGTILKLLLLTGARANEIAQLRWSEINMRHRNVELPPERTKNGRRHTIPMSDLVVAALGMIKQRDGRDHVFGRGNGGFSGWSKAKRELDEVLDIPPWRIHDLRRTCATHMGELGVMPHVIEAVIGHVSGSRAGVAGVYNRSTLEAEKAKALTMWSNHVAKLVDQRNKRRTE